MKIAYITAQTPWGKAESFILEEMLEVKRQEIDLLIIPRNPPKEIFHKEAEKLLENAVRSPLMNFKIAFIFLKSLLDISFWKILGALIEHSRNPLILIKNLAVLPKGIFIAEIIQKGNIEHIHAHWGSTTATMAYIASLLTNIPWSFTLHRGDIKENNMLKEKVKSAKFVRVISEHGKNELLKIIGSQYDKKIEVIHMGIEIPDNIINKSQIERKKFIIITPAYFLEVKGHRYLIEACAILIKKEIKNFEYILYGEGALGKELENLIREKNLVDYIRMLSLIPHEKLIEMYKKKEVDLVILPSINTKQGEHEGIPVSLMEAMAYGIPVVSTKTGGIPELLSGGAGLIIEEKSAEQLAEAIIKIKKNRDLAEEISKSGYQHVREDFNVKTTTKKILELIRRT